jgi:hypothetical protein
LGGDNKYTAWWKYLESKIGMKRINIWLSTKRLNIRLDGQDENGGKGCNEDIYLAWLALRDRHQFYGLSDII